LIFKEGTLDDPKFRYSVRHSRVVYQAIANSVVKHNYFWLNTDGRKFRYNGRHCRVVYQTMLANSVVVKTISYWLNMDGRKFR